MDQRGSRRVCGRIWLRSAGQWEFFGGGSCRWSVVMAGVNQSAVIMSIWKTSKLSSCPAMLSWRSDISWSYQVSNLILLARYSCEVGCHFKTNPWMSFWFWQTGFSTFFSYDFFVFSDLLAWESVENWNNPGLAGPSIGQCEWPFSHPESSHPGPKWVCPVVGVVKSELCWFLFCCKKGLLPHLSFEDSQPLHRHQLRCFCFCRTGNLAVFKLFH